MTEALLREYRQADIPALTALWHWVFGDPEALISRFFQLLPEMGSGAVAELDGQAVGAAYIVDGLALLRPGAAPMPLAYLYAVAVDERCRGLGFGQAVTKAAADLALARGDAFVCTLPADAGLYGFYEKLIGIRCALHREKIELISYPGPAVMPLSAEEYLRRREELLAGTCHLRLSPAAMAFEHANCGCYGGGLFAVGDGIAAAYLEDGRCVVKELLSPSDSDREALAAAIGATLQSQSVLLYSPAAEGSAYIAAPEGRLPTDCVWNLAFD